jgi:hypothetical protein
MNISLRDRVLLSSRIEFLGVYKKYIICKFQVRKLHIYAT